MHMRKNFLKLQLWFWFSVRRVIGNESLCVCMSEQRNTYTEMP